MNPVHKYTFLDRESVEDKGRNDGWWVTHTSYGRESVYSTESPSPYLFPNE